MQVYYLPLYSAEWKDYDSILLEIISGERRQYVQQHYFSIDQRLSLYSSLLAYMGIMKISGLKLNELVFSKGTKGKPKLLSIPYIDFNFSHTRSAILCGVSTESAIGTDIEAISEPPYRVMNKVFHPHEIEFINQSSAEVRKDNFYKIWTRKEAYFKRSGIGISSSVTECDTLDLCVSNELYTWIQDKYVCSVCARNVSEIELIQVTENEILNFFNTTNGI